MSGHRDRPARPAPPAIQTFLQDRTDSRIPRQLALQSVLPNFDLYRAVDFFGEPRESGGTSMLVSGSEHTRHSYAQDLAALTRTSSLTTNESVSSSMGARQLEGQRLLDQGPDGELVIRQLSAPKRFECPFNFLRCRMEFSSLDEWKNHSLSHFGRMGPPVLNRCCFCDAIFQNPNGVSCWAERMNHVAFHHQVGDRLAHARPDFELYTYLWNKRLISNAEYRDLKGNYEDRSRAIAAYPSPPVSPNERSVAYVESNNSRRPRNR